MQNSPTCSYIGRIGDQFTQKYLLVGVERVDDEAHQLSNFRLKGEGLGFYLLHFHSGVGHSSLFERREHREH